MKTVARMSEEQRAEHTHSKQKQMAGIKIANAENNKELAQKFVKAEFERRKKQAYRQKLRDQDADAKMKLQGEVVAKKDAMKENAAKAKESAQKGTMSEVRKKKEASEKEAKVIAASKAPKATNCQVGPWQAWTSCSRACSGGVMQRARDVRKPTQNGGADCPALSQSKPCNTQPCLSVTFGQGYCDQALKKCTESREQLKGCGQAPHSFGNGGQQLADMYVDTGKAAERLINKVDPDHTAREDGSKDKSDETPQTSDHDASAGGDAVAGAPKHMKLVGEAVRHDKMAASAKKSRRPSVQFAFPRDVAPATVKEAVAAAVKSAAKPKYDQFDFLIEPKKDSSQLLQIDEGAAAKVDPSGDTAKKVHETEADGNMIFT